MPDRQRMQSLTIPPEPLVEAEAKGAAGAARADGGRWH